MALASSLRSAGTEMQVLARALASFQHAAGNVSLTMAAAAAVPAAFRRDTAADVAALKTQMEATGVTARLMTAAGARAQALGLEIMRTIQQLRPFTVRPGDPRLTMFTVRAGDPRLRMFSNWRPGGRG